MMDELEFRRRLYANPNDPGREILDAAATNREWQALVDDSRKIEPEYVPEQELHIVQRRAIAGHYFIAPTCTSKDF